MEGKTSRTYRVGVAAGNVVPRRRVEREQRHHRRHERVGRRVRLDPRHEENRREECRVERHGPPQERGAGMLPPGRIEALVRGQRRDLPPVRVAVIASEQVDDHAPDRERVHRVGGVRRRERP